MRNFSAKTHKTWQIIECDREGVFGMPVSVMVLASHKPWRGMLEEEISVCACWGYVHVHVLYFNTHWLWVIEAVPV